MPDLLVRLYDLPAHDSVAKLAENGITIRRALAPERELVMEFARSFHDGWGAECGFAFSTHPVPVWIATEGNELRGFACFDATAKGFFGPTGVVETARGQGIGAALLMETLAAMGHAGYAYAVIGDVGPVAWYKKRLDALEIPGSNPGIYKDMLRRGDV